MTFAELCHAVEEASFTVLGACAPGAGDPVPAGCKTLVLIGNAGPAMWRRFVRERAKPDTTMDSWTEGVLAELAHQLGCTVLFPFAKPPLPFLTWAQKAKAGFVSPLGMNIHPDYGLWHAFRGALAVPAALDLPDPDGRPSPCDACTQRACLSTCPVGAFDGRSYDVDRCAAHIATPAGADCLNRGCRARLACPAGADYRYLPEQAHFHMSAFLAARSRN
ncbi:MAG: hypothetical protein AAF441_28230 [Pseudomonadota bacterium]